MTKEAEEAATALVSLMYSGRTGTCLDTVRYELFSKNNLASDKLPPAMDAFRQHMRGVNYIYLDTCFNTYKCHHQSTMAQKHDTGIKPCMMTILPAPEAVLGLLSATARRTMGFSVGKREDNGLL